MCECRVIVLQHHISSPLLEHTFSFQGLFWPRCFLLLWAFSSSSCSINYITSQPCASSCNHILFLCSLCKLMIHTLLFLLFSLYLLSFMCHSSEVSWLMSWLISCQIWWICSVSWLILLFQIQPLQKKSWFWSRCSHTHKCSLIPVPKQCACSFTLGSTLFIDPRNVEPHYQWEF